MRTRKKVMAMAAAIGLTMTGSGAAYGYSGTATLDTKSVTNNGGVNSVITGTINVTDISVEVPITSCFDIDPNKPLTVPNQTTGQITGQAANYTITNKSAVPLDISITKVETGLAAGTAGDAPTIVTTLGDVKSTNRGILFSIRPKDTTVAAVPVLPGSDSTAVADTWLKPNQTAGADKGKVGADYKFTDAATGANKYTLEQAGTAGGKDQLNMWLYAVTQKGWTSGNGFTITPTFTVSLHTS